MNLDGLIEDILPDGRFRVHLENGHRIIAWTGQDAALSHPIRGG